MHQGGTGYRLLPGHWRSHPAGSHSERHHSRLNGSQEGVRTPLDCGKPFGSAGVCAPVHDRALRPREANEKGRSNYPKRMLKRSTLTALFFVILTYTTAQAQNLSPSGVTSDKLVASISANLSFSQELRVAPLLGRQALSFRLLSEGHEPLTSGAISYGNGFLRSEAQALHTCAWSHLACAHTVLDIARVRGKRHFANFRAAPECMQLHP